MNYLTQIQINELADAVPHFETVLKHNYKRNTPNDLNKKVAEIYNKTTGTKREWNYSCPQCMFDLYKACGQLYYDSIDSTVKVAERIDSTVKVAVETEPKPQTTVKQKVTESAKKMVTNKSKKSKK